MQWFFFVLVLVLLVLVMRTRKIDCFRKTTGKGGYSGAK
jgi:hypothetical protein